MAIQTKDTGHGGSITFATSALTYKWRKIGAVKQGREKVQASDLSLTKYHFYLPGDLAEPGEIELEFCYDPSAAQPNPIAAAELITITGPIPPGGATAGNLAGRGFITEITASPEYTTNGLQIGTMKVAFDGTLTGIGTTGPNWTAAA